jgi:hypothetical protein
LSPTLTLGDHNYLQYFRKFPRKYELFWLNGSQGKKINDLAKFSWLSDLALYLNNLEFPIPKDDLYQVWLKLASWFSRIYFFRHKHEYGFPYHHPSQPQGIMILKTWIYIISESFHVNMNYSGSVVLKKKLNDSTSFWYFCYYIPFEKELALYLNNLESPLPKNDLCQVSLKLACWLWRRGLLFNINRCKYGFPYYGPTRPPRTMVWTILNLHYIRNFSCKYDLFCVMTPCVI